MNSSQNIHSRHVFNFDSSRYATNFLIVIDNPGFFYPRKVVEKHHGNTIKDVETGGTSMSRDYFTSGEMEQSTTSDGFYNRFWDYKKGFHMGKDPIKDETFYYIKDESNHEYEDSSKHSFISTLKREDDENVQFGNFSKWILQFSPTSNSFESNFLIHYETEKSFYWNDLKLKVFSFYKSILDQLFNNKNGEGYFAKSLISIQRYDYNDIVKILQSEFEKSSYNTESSIISDIENAFNVSKLVATNDIRKLELEDIQNDLIQLKSLLEKPVKDQAIISNIIDIRNTLIEKLNSGIELEKFLQELGTSEREMEDRLEQVEEGGVFEIRWKNH